MKFEELKKKIEEKRLEDYKQCLREQKNTQAEYDAYISQFKSYSYEEMRDYGHTWGPGFEPEEPEAALPSYYKIEGLQEEVLRKMISADIVSERDIEYIFLNKCAWDDEYPICQLGNEYTFETILLCLLEHWENEALWYEKKIEEKALVWSDQDIFI